jgi:hypothetical protein|nr:hypothetical protein [Kofleriaceae bacterium]
MRARLLAIVVVAACGTSDSKPTEPKHEDGKHEEAEHHEMAMPPALDAFHKILAPHWHAAPGDQRTTDTCNAIPDFTRGAATVGAAPLVDAVTGLADACAASPRDPAKFDAAFQKVHEAFHAQLGEHE